MAEEVVSDVTFSSVWASVHTLGFLTGVIVVCAVVLLVLILWFFLWLKRRHRYLVISVQDGSEFKVSLRAVRTHLASYLARAYPRLVLERVTLRGCRGGLRAEVDVKAHCGENMQALSARVMKDLQDSLNDTMGLGELFTRVDVVICSLEEESAALSVQPSAPTDDSASEPLPALPKIDSKDGQSLS